MKLFADPLRIGVAAEYDSPEGVRAAAHALRDAGYRRVDAYVPFEMEDLDEILDIPRGRIPLAVLVAALTGAAVGFLIQWWTNAIDYPINVGGRPLNSAPAFLLITFESAVLLGSLTAFFAVVFGSRLPEPWNPLSEIDGFERASIDRFWIGVDRTDALYDGPRISELLRNTDPIRVVTVAPEHGVAEVTRDPDAALAERRSETRTERDDEGPE